MRPLRLPPNSSLYHREGHLGSEAKTGLCPMHQTGVLGPCGRRGSKPAPAGHPRCQPGTHLHTRPPGRGKQCIYSLLVCGQLKAGAPPVCQAMPWGGPGPALTAPHRCPDRQGPRPAEDHPGLPAGRGACRKRLSCHSRKFHSQCERSRKEGPGVLSRVHERDQDRGAQGQAPDGAD